MVAYDNQNYNLYGRPKNKVDYSTGAQDPNYVGPEINWNGRAMSSGLSSNKTPRPDLPDPTVHPTKRSPFRSYTDKDVKKNSFNWDVDMNRAVAENNQEIESRVAEYNDLMKQGYSQTNLAARKAKIDALQQDTQRMEGQIQDVGALMAISEQYKGLHEQGVAKQEAEQKTEMERIRDLERADMEAGVSREHQLALTAAAKPYGQTEEGFRAGVLSDEAIATIKKMGEISPQTEALNDLLKAKYKSSLDIVEASKTGGLDMVTGLPLVSQEVSDNALREIMAIESQVGGLGARTSPGLPAVNQIGAGGEPYSGQTPKAGALLSQMKGLLDSGKSKYSRAEMVALAKQTYPELTDKEIDRALNPSLNDAIFARYVKDSQP